MEATMNPSNSASVASPIKKFPPEILTAVFAHLSRVDIKNCRCTSHQLEEIASTFLFRVIFISVSIKSFDRLRQIANHPTLGKCVRVINYNPLKVKNVSEEVAISTPGSNLFELWKKYDWVRADGPNANYTESHLQFLYESWRERVADEKALSPALEKNILVDAMGRLPELQALQYDSFASGELHVYTEGDLSPWAVSSCCVSQELHVDKRRIWNEIPPENTFWTLLDAAYAAGRTSSIIKLKGTYLNLSIWNSLGQSISPGTRCFTNLIGLDLQFEQTYSEETTTCLRQIIVNSPLLQHIKLAFGQLGPDEEDSPRGWYIHLSDFIDTSHYWKNLKHLSLSSLMTTGTELREFLHQHHRSLRSLALSNIFLSLEQNDRENEEEGFEEDGMLDSWLDIIEFLRSCLSLNRMRFDGLLYNDRNEAWQLENPVDTAFSSLSPEISLKSRIEKYICNGCENPIERVPMDRVRAETRQLKYDSGGLDIPYIWEDETWRIDLDAFALLEDSDEEENDG